MAKVDLVPKGPQGQKRSADVIGAAIRAARIATGEEEEDLLPVKSAAAELGSKGGTPTRTLVLKGIEHPVLAHVLIAGG
jgi:hypothetical protein